MRAEVRKVGGVRDSLANVHPVWRDTFLSGPSALLHTKSSLTHIDSAAFALPVHKALTEEDAMLNVL